LAAWIKPEKNNNYVISWGNPGYGTGRWNALAVFGSKVGHVFYGTGMTTLGNTVISVDGSTWYHFAAVYDGTILRVYLDGEEDGSNIPASTPVVSGSDLLVSRDPAGDYPGKGTFDEARVYSRALTADEIADRLATTSRVEKPGYPGYIQRYRKHVSSAAKGAVLT